MTTQGSRIVRRLVAVATAALTIVATTTSAAPANTTFPKWSGHARIDTNGGIASVSCPTAQMCVALGDSTVDYKVTAMTWNGLKWTHYRQLPLYAFASISCPTATFCMAVGAGGDGTAHGAALRWNGTKWSSLNNIDAVGVYFTSVSCTSAKFCLAADTSGNVLTWNGTKWSASVNIDNSVLTAVECVSGAFCVAGDGFGLVFMYKNKVWHQAPAITGAVAIVSISCATSKFCVAAGASNQGFAATWNGTNWSAMKHIDTEQTTSVSCPTTTYCVAVDDKGWNTVYNGKRWADVRPISELVLFNSISCPTRRFCVTTAADTTGWAYWTPLPKPTIVLTDNARKIKHGQTLVFTVRLSSKGRTPTGTVRWTLTGPGSPACHPTKLKLGKATCDIKNARRGKYTATAHYSGNSWYRPVSIVDRAAVG